MSGHSKWSTIKHKKAALDAKRGRMFTRLIREITIAARQGGGDPTGNARLRAAVVAAKDANMPADNIQRAIKKGTGELEGSQLEEISYEGYAPGGVAVIVEAVTDNKNRTLPEIRHIFTKHGGNLAAANSVAWMFEKKGYLVVPAASMPEDQVLELVLEAGADDMSQDGGNFEVYTPPENFEAVKEALRAKGVVVEAAEVALTPKNTVRAEGSTARKVLNLVEALEEHDDVQHVWANFDIDASEMEAS
ncbi:MAG TPA: YebC/PmpR family DNA-binding transcriptional regulator [Candidatus Polarisedimenticolia bacterium]|nr:YebC/PmpR family DNA-binding transcriptional regulator [Candidatus Polarisedimenticolia bacterium]